MSPGMEELIAGMESHLDDPRQGLPEEVFLLVSRITPLVNVDLLIKDDGGRSLLTWRDDGYHPAGWHVPGGIIRYRETMESRIHAVAALELGAAVSFAPAPVALNQLFHPTRRNRGHFISLLFECRLTSPPDERLRYSGGAPEPGQWAWHGGAPENLIIVHEIYRCFM